MIRRPKMSHHSPSSSTFASRLVIISTLHILIQCLHLHHQPATAHYLNHHHQQQQQHLQQQQYSTYINGPTTIGGNNGGQQPAPDPRQQQPPPVTHLEQQQQPQQEAPPQISHREVATRDSPIIRFEARILNSTSVRLVWSLSIMSHADYFDISYGPIPDTHLKTVSKLNGTVRDYTFHGLEPDTHYQFELYSYQGDRAYKPQLVAVRTPPANWVPPSKSHPMDAINPSITPFGVKADAKSNSSIQLSWTEPERPAHFKNSIRMNQIRYYINAAPSAASQQQVNNESASGQQPGGPSAAPPESHYLNVTNARESRVIVQKLRPATEYAFAIKTLYFAPDMKRLFTQSGFSMDTLARTYDLEPSAPRNFTIQALPPGRDDLMAGKTTGTIEFSWLPPESPNGQLKGYRILYAQDLATADDQWHKIDVNGANINSWSAANVKPGYNYYFKIRAINQRGQSADSEVRPYMSPAPPPLPVPSLPIDKMLNMPVPPNNVLLLIIICMVAILFLLFLIVSKLACRTRSGSGGRKSRKASLNNGSTQKATGVNGLDASGGGQGAKLSAFNHTGSSSTVVARVGTLARRGRGDNLGGPAIAKPDFWAMAADQSLEVKSNGSEKNVADMNMAMVSIQRDSPQFATTQLAPALPDYRFAAGQSPAEQHLLQQLQQQQQQGHYHPGQFMGSLAYDQMDNAQASALLTLSKRQHQQLQKYQIQFAPTGGPPTSGATTLTQAPSPHQQPPPPPPLNIEQQQQQHHQPLYGAHQPSMGGNTRSLRIHRPTLYDPVSGAFVQAHDGGGPPNYSSHNNTQMHHQLLGGQHMMGNGPQFGGPNHNASNTLQFHPHQTSTLLSRRSTNTLRSFQTSAGAYGQFLGAATGGNLATGGPGGGGGQTVASGGQFVPPPPPAGSIAAGGATAASAGGNQQQPQQLLQSHQAVINQLNNSTYPSLPLKHVSAVRPQVMSSLKDQIEMELAEKEQQQQDQQQTIKQ